MRASRAVSTLRHMSSAARPTPTFTAPSAALDERAAALTLAARAQVDPRTALRALRAGTPDVIGVLAARERVRAAMVDMDLIHAERLGIELDEPAERAP